MTRPLRVRLLACVLALAAGTIVAGQAPSDISSHVVFSSDRGLVHASSIVETPSDGLYVAWYENGDPSGTGPFEGQDLDKREDVRVAGSRLAPGATTWSAPWC